MKDDDGFPIHSGARKLSPCKMPNEEGSDKLIFWPGEFDDKAIASLILEKTSDLVAITTFSLSPRYVYLSPSHKRILGYDPSDLLNKSPFDLIHPDDIPKLFLLLEKYVTLLSQAKGPPSELKLPTERLFYRFMDKSGNWRSLETTGDLIADDRILFISRDVTERVKAEHDLFESRMALQTKVEERTRELTSANETMRESERTYRNILESIEDGYYEVDLEGNLTFFNAALCRITGYSPEELHGMSNRDYTEPEMAKRMFEIFNRVYRTGEPSKIDDYEVIRKDGTKSVMELSTSLIRDPAGKAIGFRGIARDITERRLIQKALEESEEKYRTILKNIEEIYYELDPKGNLLFFNESISRIFGYSSEELMGMNNRQYMSQETAKEVYRVCTEVYRSGVPAKAFDWEVIRKDGEKRHMETSISVLRDSHGKPIGFRGVARDITERWLARKAIEESEKKYRMILQSIEDGYYEVDLRGNMVFFNESMCKILGYSDQELMGMNNRQYMSEKTSKQVYQTFHQVYVTGESTKLLGWEMIRKDGEKRYLQTIVSLRRGSQGEPIGFGGIARDVTELWLARKSVEESEKKYRTILESIEEGYFEVDIKGNFVFFNESMCKILGYPEQKLKGMNNRQFMSEETSKKVFQTFNQVYRTGDPARTLGWELIRKDGERRYVETSVSLIRNPKGEAVGFRGIARDITESKRLEKAKERAINHLSHELGTPLSIIAGALNRMPDELSKGNMERIYGWIERMKRNIGRLRDLQTKIEDILNEKPVREKERILNIIETAIAFLDELKDEPLKEGGEAVRQSIIKRLESLHKVEEFRKETIVLDVFISQVCEEARLSMKNRDLEIVEKVERGIAVEMDPKVLKKVCEGFLKNAIENTPDEGRIEIALKAEDNLAKIYFHDFGMGITPENQKLIFSGFFHTQDTDRYASKKPYLFNAGGAGSDLLRARVLSERFGFSVDFSSTRCTHLPSDKDECPGSISLCPFIKGKEECLASGGSTFFLHLPLKKP
jgi:PAS domain S-box-containing protein